jgi:hypothetical protein
MYACQKNVHWNTVLEKNPILADILLSALDTQQAESRLKDLFKRLVDQAYQAQTAGFVTCLIGTKT